MNQDFGFTDRYSDIALLVLGKPVGTKKPVWIEINKSPTTPAMNSMAKVLGFGALKNGSTASSVSLYQVDVKVGPGGNPTCPALPTVICAGSPGKDACIGDAGGPLVQKVGGKWTLIGLAQRSPLDGCAPVGRTDAFAPYTKMTNFEKWLNKTIVENTGGSVSSPPHAFHDLTPFGSLSHPDPRSSGGGGAPILSGSHILVTSSGSQIRCVPGNRACALVPSGGTTWNAVKSARAGAADDVSIGDTVRWQRCTKTGFPLCLSVEEHSGEPPYLSTSSEVELTPSNREQDSSLPHPATPPLVGTRQPPPSKSSPSSLPPPEPDPASC